MSTIRKFVAITIGKAIMFFSRALGVGGGSAYSGLIALKIYPNLISEISCQIKNGVIVITGTNGKTTTAKYLLKVLEASGLEVVANHSGSNLKRGIAAALIEQSSLLGFPKGNMGLFEVDEASMSELVPILNPKFVLVTNLFRDQLDRYGELDKTAEIMAQSFSHLKHSTVVLNADDPRVFSLYKDVPGDSRIKCFGIEGDDSKVANSSAAFDSFDNKECVFCNNELKFRKRYFAHMGDYECPNCGYSRPQPAYFASEIDLKSITEAKAKFSNGSTEFTVYLRLSGIYNIYNALSAYSIAQILEVPDEMIKHSIEGVTAAFGRMEKIRFKGKHVYLFLAKNPTSLTQVIEILTSDKTVKNFLICLNDNPADGADISWIWDADVEKLNDCIKSIICAGIRANDMALRLKYAGCCAVKADVCNDIKHAFNKTIMKLDENETLYIVATYTAMLELRNYLTRKGVVAGFWKADL